MKRNLWVLVAAAVIASGGWVQADTYTFTTTSGTVDYAVNADGTGPDLGAGFYVGPDAAYDGSSALSETHSGGYFEVSADSSTYSDAGLVLYFDGSLTLKDLGSISITSSGRSPLSVNLWLDESGDDQFFAFNPSESFNHTHKLTSLNGDYYYGSTGTFGPGTSSLDGSNSFSALTGGEPGGTYTLAQFQHGDVAGISGDTPVALWIGITSQSTAYANNYTYIQSITVTTNPPAAVPVPASVWGGLVLMGGLGALGGVKRLDHRSV